MGWTKPDQSQIGQKHSQQNNNHRPAGRENQGERTHSVGTLKREKEEREGGREKKNGFIFSVQQRSVNPKRFGK